MNRIIAASISVGMSIGMASGQAKPQPKTTVVHSGGSNPAATVFTYNRWPLVEALLAIEQEYGWAIDFETAPVVNSSEVVDDSPGDTTRAPEFPVKPLNPRGMPFQSTFPEEGNGKANINIVLQQVLRDYNASGNPGHYSLQRTTAGGYVVIGDRYKSGFGTEAVYKPILNCVISAVIPRLSLEDALAVVAKSVNNTCHDQVLNAVYAANSPDELGLDQVSGTYNQTIARDIIEDLLAQEPVLMSYGVDYVPGIDQFYLETFVIYKRVGGGGLKGSHLEVVPQRSTGGSTTPSK